MTIITNASKHIYFCCKFGPFNTGVYRDFLQEPAWAAGFGATSQTLSDIDFAAWPPIAVTTLIVFS